MLDSVNESYDLQDTSRYAMLRGVEPVLLATPEPNPRSPR